MMIRDSGLLFLGHPGIEFGADKQGRQIEPYQTGRKKSKLRYVGVCCVKHFGNRRFICMEYARVYPGLKEFFSGALTHHLLSVNFWEAENI